MTVKSMIRFMKWCKAERIFLALFVVSSLMTIARAQSSNDGNLREGLFLRRHDSMIGLADDVMKRLVEGRPIHPLAGDKVTFQNGNTETWTADTAGSDGWFKGDYLDEAYAYFCVFSDVERVVLIEAMGDETVYCNGVPREGNKYGYKDKWESWEPNFSYSRIPVKLKRGTNEFLFVCNRGVLKAKLESINPCVHFNGGHVTVPDLVVGRKVDEYAGIDIINATEKPIGDAFIEARNENGISAVTKLQLVQPMSVRKARFKLAGNSPLNTGDLWISLQLFEHEGNKRVVLDSTSVDLRVVAANATRNMTYLSDVDSSVQYYSVVPPVGPDDGKPKALFLSLHGAGVITRNMANSYYPKSWGYIVCPTNGGPYGYDWEDWGRLDALQVLGIAKSELNVDPSRVYLTGHSMGGHGTWIIGAQFPDQFGAIGPSAGWISWWTYVARNDTSSSPIARMIKRATTPVHTYEFVQNYKQLGLYILHGSKDDNVPVTESVNMADTLSKFDRDFVFHEQPDAGHWWSLNDQTGADCVDWPPMFDYFARHARINEREIENLDFTTANPGVSAKDYWVTIYSQERQLEPSRVILRFNPSRNSFTGTTVNTRVVAFDLSLADRTRLVSTDLDGQKLDSIAASVSSDKLWLQKFAGTWRVIPAPSPDDKGPGRYGTFKDAFRHDVEFVYGTHGNSEENEWAIEKARFDAEYMWYQGGGSVDIVSDEEFQPDAAPDRSVILYGNSETNSAWKKVLDDFGIRVLEGRLIFDKRIFDGPDYLCLMVRPRRGSSIASVGIVGGTEIEGMRLASIIPYLQPGFGLPDLTILNADIFSKWESGIKVAGFFGHDWGFTGGEFVEEK